MAWIALFYSLINLIAFIAYALDKWAAARQRPRIAERTLHTFAFLGGAPAAMIAQQLMRHKRRKIPFVLITWTALLLHAGGWIGWWWIAAQD